jgi:NitT/TauT family transport system substrate-binding protein
MVVFDWYALPKYKSIAETKGGRYAVSKFGSLTDSLTRYALRSAGLDPEKDVTILQLGGSTQGLAAMEAGQIDVAILPSPQSYMAAEKGFVKVMSEKEQIAPDWPTHVVYAKEEFTAKNPNTMKAFLRASGRAMEWIKANPDEAAQLASKQLVQGGTLPQGHWRDHRIGSRMAVYLGRDCTSGDCC